MQRNYELSGWGWSVLVTAVSLVLPLLPPWYEIRDRLDHLVWSASRQRLDRISERRNSTTVSRVA